MVSLNDTAAQLHISTLKQEAAEAAFKARHSFGSSDAFKQIFDGIDKTTASISAPKDDAEPVRHDAHKLAHERNAARKSEHAERKDDSISNAADEDTETSEAEVKKIGAPKHDKTKVAKKDKTDDADDCDKDDCDKAEAAADVTTETKVAAKPATDDADTSVIDLLDVTTGDVKADVKADAETPAVIAQDSGSQSTDGAVDANAAQTAPAPTAQSKPDIAAILLANLQLVQQAETQFTVQQQVVDFQKSVPAHHKAAQEKAGKTAGDFDAADAFAAAVDGDAELSKDAKIKDAQETAKDERAAKKEASQKHADHLDQLQGKASANATPPAAGDRAISVALKASDSSAPTLNGSAGSGSPITSKGDAATAALGGLEGLRQGRAGEPTSFAATLRGTKEAQASLMVPSEQIAVSLHRMAKSGTSQYEMQLHPAELGRVDIKLEINKDGLVHATVTADNQQAFDMLQKDQRALERALQQAGLQTDENSLSFSLRDGSNQAQQQHAQQNSGNAWNKWMDKTLPDEPVPSKVLTYDIAGTNGRVDLRV